MKQISLGEMGFERKSKRTRMRESLDEMSLVVPWALPGFGNHTAGSRSAVTFVSAALHSLEINAFNSSSSFRRA